MFLTSGDEEAVTIEVYIGPHKVEAMLDTGARHSVIDSDTGRGLGLPVFPAAHKVYGLCNNPVRVNGYIDAPIKGNDREPVIERIEVLDSNEPTILIGRNLWSN